MFCKICGTQNADTALNCQQCGQPLKQSVGQPIGMQSIPNYLVQAILVTIFCCLPFGIVAIVYAAQVNSQLSAGNVQGALNSSNNAKMWCWISFGVGLVFTLGMVALQMIAAMGAMQGFPR